MAHHKLSSQFRISFLLSQSISSVILGSDSIGERAYSMNCFWISLFLERLRCRYTMVDCISTWPRRFLISVIEAPLRSIWTAQEWLKWGAPHLRHYGEKYKMVSDDSKPAKSASCSSIHSPFYHWRPSEIRKSIRFLSSDQSGSSLVGRMSTYAASSAFLLVSVSALA